MTNTNLTPRITLHPALPSDSPTLTTVESLTFSTEEFTTLALGPLRNTPENLSQEAEHTARKISTSTENEWMSYVKAIVNISEGEQGKEKEKVVGFAAWKYVLNRNEISSSDLNSDETKQKNKQESNSSEAHEKSKSAEEISAEKEAIWGRGADVKFCEDAFLPADEVMERCCAGRDYCKLTTLAILPSYQRQGIGTQLLTAGLAEVDRRRLQTVLGASPEAEGLYRRFGFEVVEEWRHRLWEYVDGEGMGEARHVVMYRAARV